jgi:hypothetical protein
MPDKSKMREPAEVMREINRTWLEKRIDDLIPFFHEEIMMVFPGFSGTITGRKQFLDGFRDFVDHAVVNEFREEDYQTDIAGNTAVISFNFAMDYERAGKRYHSTGRDLWVFEGKADSWIAVWRTMIGVDEKEI